MNNDLIVGTTFMTPDLYNLLLARYARRVPEPAPAPEAAEPSPPTKDEARAARFDTARDAAIKSFFNRYGRIPSDADIEQSIDAFLPPDLRAIRSQGRPATALDAPAANQDVRNQQREAKEWEVEAVARTYQQQWGRLPTAEELDRELGLSRGPTNPFLRRTPPYQEPQPPGIFEQYMLPLFRRLTPAPMPPPPGVKFSSTPRG